VQLDVAKVAFHQEDETSAAEGDGDQKSGDDDDDGKVNPREVGHNIYILAHQVTINKSGCC
jgi:hypothetical protein